MIRTPAQLTEFTVDQKARFWLGFDAYCDGMPEPSDPDESRGWWHALNCHAQADMAHAEFEEMETTRLMMAGY